jgi:3-hydroxyacyl-CoA dehydrogenase / enoyl-CoA hydratase / 3-hydroxybutyryl-CoA epimerase
MSIQYDKDGQGIVTLTMDMPGRPVNVINQEFFTALQAALERLTGEADLKGVILTSAKSTFIAGGDIDVLYALKDPAETFAFIEQVKALFRRLETLGSRDAHIPVVAALNGTALGGGVEVALACHYRIALDHPKIKFGFPEVTLGLLPGGGGVTRLTRLLGLQAAFPYLVEGSQASPQEALKAGIIHELAPDMDSLLQQARNWIAKNPQTAQPWDQKGYRMPGGDPSRPQVMQMISVAPAMLLQKTRGNYPAPEAILSAMVEGAQVDFETACRIESRYFTQLVTGQTAKNMLQAFWYQMNAINNGSSRPNTIEPQQTHKVGILGAGLMGQGIAYVSAMAGIEVVLKDVSLEKAEAGKTLAAKILEERLSKGRISPEEREAILERIHPTGRVEDFQGCDLVIEAVFEDRQLKGRVTQETEAQLDPTAIFGSNTSTLPITGLAERSMRPENFIGIHFFSPVHKMKLVEIIRGRQTLDQAVAKAFDYVLQIRKTPIIVNDGRGFYTSRVFTTFVNEGMALLKEGQHPRAIEAAGLQAGMPVGPLAVSDEVNLGLALHIREQTRKDFASEGKELARVPADDVLELIVKVENRPGKAQGAGFYEYPQGEKKYLWPRLQVLFPPASEPLSQVEMIERMMFVQALEAVRCLQDGVLGSVADGNIGSILGWGFAPFKGGALQYITDYGLPTFIQRSRQLAEAYGDRFTPPALLLQMEAEGTSF